MVSISYASDLLMLGKAFSQGWGKFLTNKLQAKRKSITGVKRKHPKPALQKTPIFEPRTTRDASLGLTVLETAPKPRELLSTRSVASNKPLPRRRAKQPTMKPIIKHISQSTIRSRWTYLDEDAQAKVANMFRSVELPVLARYASEKKKIEAQLTIGSVTKTWVL